LGLIVTPTEQGASAPTEAIVDPLPHRYLTSEEGIGGCIKVRPEDFLVEELPLYEPCGRGEHLYLRVQKVATSHGELISRLQRHFGVGESAIGFAGMKDKMAVTSQTVSIHLLTDPPTVDLDHERIVVLGAKRHTNKIRRGHLAGNRFSVRIRDVDPLKAPLVLRRVRQLEATGVPCYFGYQRFGYRRNTHLLGAALLNRDWRGLLAELLGTTGSPYPEYQRERRELFDAGRYQDALAQWSTSDQAERRALGALCRGQSNRSVSKAVRVASRLFWISALQSAIFNRVLDRRLEDGTLLHLFEGDLAWKHDSRAVFAVTAEEVEGEAGATLAERVRSLQVSPSGPVWGWGMTEAAGRTREREREAMAASGTSAEVLLDRARGSKGARRPLRVVLANADVDSGLDEHGPYIRTAFDLPRGAYATVVLREIMKPRDGNLETGATKHEGAS